MPPFTFKGGLHIPRDTSLGFTVDQLNLDFELYPNPDRFDPSKLQVGYRIPGDKATGFKLDFVLPLRNSRFSAKKMPY